MTTELSFLIELLLNHKLQKETKEILMQRIKEVEARYSAGIQPMRANPLPLPPNLAMQSPSTIAAMIKHGDLPQEIMQPVMIENQVPVTQVAQTPATAAALASRQQALNGAVDASGKKRKW